MALGKFALALLGLLAYQNRDKIGDFLHGQAQPGQTGSSQGGGILDGIVGGCGLREVLDRFRNVGAGEQIESWVSRGENQPLQRDQIEQAIDPTTLDELSRQTGLSQQELIDRIAKDLPAAVDKLTPMGQLPPEESRGPNLLDDVPPARANS